MSGRFEFAFHTVAGSPGSPDAQLALLGSQGWEIRGIAKDAPDTFVVALQRAIDEEHPLPERGALAATLEAPLIAPGPEELDTV